MNRHGTTDVGLLFLRLGFAALMLALHGWARFFRAYHYVVDKQPWTFVDVVARLGFPLPAVFAVLSALSESIAVALIALGLFTRWAAAVVALDMVVAFYNEAQKGDPYELPALYLLAATALVIMGAGRFSLDGRMRRRI
jgi:putative oxidoreductase